MMRLYERLAGANALLGVLLLVVGLAAVPQRAHAHIIIPIWLPYFECEASGCGGCDLLAPCITEATGSCVGKDCTVACSCQERTETLTGTLICAGACPYVIPPLPGVD